MVKPISFPARLHVLLAREAPYGVVIRRGPSKQGCTIGWDLTTDTFTLGQWLKGRIYEHNCDISPDGRHMIYFVRKGRSDSETTGAYTAISKTPYLKAIGLWPQGNTYGAGGHFVNNQEFWLNGGGGEPIRLPNELRRVENYPMIDQWEGHLLLGGWEYKGQKEDDPPTHVFEKTFPYNWILRRFSCLPKETPVGRASFFYKHELENTRLAQKIDHSSWEWAEKDRDRLVWAEGGKLWAGRLDAKGMVDVRTLYDFNPMKFEPIVAPY